MSCETLHCLVLETLWLTAHLLGGVMKVEKDFQLTVANEKTKKKHEYTIQKGSLIALAYITLSLNPNSWKDPHILNLSSLCSEDLYKDEFFSTTFSHGIYKCPGYKLAFGNVTMHLLHDYKITLSNIILLLLFERATLAQRKGLVNLIIKRKATSY